MLYANGKASVFDLRTGQRYDDPTAYAALLVFPTSEGVIFCPSTTALAASADPKTFLAASGGRAARARIAPVDHTGRAALSRWTVDGVVPMTLDPWRRPKVSATVARSYSVAFRSGSVWRAGRLYRRAVVQAWEIEIEPATEIVTVGGLRMARHACRQALATSYGVLSMNVAEGLRLVSTGDRLYSGQASVLQYLGAGDAPTGEYVLEAQGRWDAILDAYAFPAADTGLRKAPAVVAMNNLVVADATNTRLEIYDLLGRHLFTSEPPGGRVEDEW